MPGTDSASIRRNDHATAWDNESHTGLTLLSMCARPWRLQESNPAGTPLIPPLPPVTPPIAAVDAGSENAVGNEVWYLD